MAVPFATWSIVATPTRTTFSEGCNWLEIENRESWLETDRTTQSKPGSDASADKCPVVVEDAFEQAGNDARDAHREVEQGLEMVRPHDVHEQAIAGMVDVVDRAMEPGVVEDEERVLAPVMGGVVYLDEDVLASDRFEIVQHAIGQTQRAEMPGRAFTRTECRYRDGLDVTVIA